MAEELVMGVIHMPVAAAVLAHCLMQSNPQERKVNQPLGKRQVWAAINIL